MLGQQTGRQNDKLNPNTAFKLMYMYSDLTVHDIYLPRYLLVHATNVDHEAVDPCRFRAVNI